MTTLSTILLPIIWDAKQVECWAIIVVILMVEVLTLWEVTIEHFMA